MRTLLTLAISSLLVLAVAGQQAPVQESVEVVHPTAVQVQRAQALYLDLMHAAWARASAHGARTHPFLSPTYASLLAGEVPLPQLHKEGFGVLPGTSSTPEIITAVLRDGADGLITDRPDRVSSMLAAEISHATPEARHHLEHFDIQAHRGGRGLRPENTLPSFENGMDSNVPTLELDTAITSDGFPVIWHDQFMNPRSCHRPDGTLLPEDQKPMLHELSLAAIQSGFVCDRLYFGPDGKNDRSLSPVASAFAREEHLPDPYTPITLPQLFRFVEFYERFYTSGPGAGKPGAGTRAAEARSVRFNIETKLTPLPLPAGQVPRTAAPQVFVDTLWKSIATAVMQRRCEIQSFDFRTLALVETQHADLPTYYLTATPDRLQRQLEALRSAP